jgi:hypothetical protein
MQVGNSANFYGDGINSNWVAGVSLNSYRSANTWYNTSASLPTGRFEIANGAASTTGGFSWHWGTGGTAGGAAAQSQFMTLDTSGRLLVGSNSAVSGLTSGAIQVGAGPFAALITTGSGDTTRIITEGAIEFNYDGVSGTQRRGKIRGTGNTAGGPYAGGLAFEYNSFNGSAYQWYTGIELNSVGNVGIGTSSPAGKLSLRGAFSTTQTAGLTIESTGSTTGLLAPIAFYLQSSGWGTVHQANITAQQVSGSDGGANLIFSTSTTGQFTPTEHMRLDSNGALLFNTSANGSRIHVRQYETVTGAIAITGTTWVGMDFFNANANAGARNWRLATTYNRFGLFELVSGSTSGGTDYATCLSLYRGESLALEGANTQTGTGITFPATQSASSNANTLDDYEEGFFTATVTTSTSGTITLNGGVDKLAYTKIGRVVYVQGLLEISSVSSPVGVVVYIQGLPFTTADLDEYAGRAGTAFSVKGIVTGANIYEGQTQVEVNIDASTLASGNQFYVSFNYIAA